MCIRDSLHGGGADFDKLQGLHSLGGADGVADGDIADAGHGDDVAGSHLGDRHPVQAVKLIDGSGLGLLADLVQMCIRDRVCITLAVTVICAKLVGCTLPMLAEKLGFDPAVMASPFITTIVDAVSLLIYFFFAQLLLGIG